MKRSRVNPNVDRKIFSKTAKHIHPMNMLTQNTVMRGGIRL